MHKHFALTLSKHNELDCFSTLINVQNVAIKSLVRVNSCTQVITGNNEAYFMLQINNLTKQRNILEASQVE